MDIYSRVDVRATLTQRSTASAVGTVSPERIKVDASVLLHVGKERWG